MNQNELLNLLEKENISFELTEHPAAFSMNEIRDYELPHPEADAKNLFLRDDKKRNYYLITVRGNKRADLKAFRQKHGLRPLSFANEEALKELLDLKPGSVTPFGLLNDSSHKVHFFYDQDFLNDDLIACHPMINTATVTLKMSDLIRLLESRNIPSEAVIIDETV